MLLPDGGASRCFEGHRHCQIVAGMPIHYPPSSIVSNSTCRTMPKCIQHSHILLLTSSHSRCLLSLVSTCSLQARKQLMIDRLLWEHFEQLQVMKFVWQTKITNVVAWNSIQIDEGDLVEYQEMLDTKVLADQFDMDADEFMLED